MIHLTALEDQVLHVLRKTQEQYTTHPSNNIEVTSGMIYQYGVKLVGPEWCGPECTNAALSTSHPTLNATLGRLQQKGLLIRTPSDIAARKRRSWSFWSLSPLGMELLGVPIESVSTP